MERTAFLANIRQSLQTMMLPDSQLDLPPQPELPPFEPHLLVDQFVEEATKLQAQVHRTASEDDAFETILGIFAEYNTQDYIAWHGEWLPLDHLNDRLIAQGMVKQDANLPSDVATRQQLLAELAPTTIGITGTMGALADTGSIAVQSGAGRGRLTSLLPPVHIALLKTELLYPTMAHFLRAQPEMVMSGSNLVFISGPSRTADIEGILTLGIHGPKELHILLI